MRKEIHPEYFPAAKVVCSCGNTFTVGATMADIRIDVCSNCHPLYTGKMKLMDAARRVDKFNTRLEKSRVKQDAK